MATPVGDTHAARRAALLAGATALAAGVLALNHLLVGVFYDDGLYAGLAQALGRGRGYVHLHLPGAPAAVHYPPLYPVVLAPLFATLSVDAAAFAAKVLNLACATATASLVAWHATRRRLLGDAAPWWLPGVVVAAAATAIPALATQAVLFAEPLFCLLLAAAVVVTDSPPSRLRPATAGLLAGTLTALALLTRSIGVAAAVGLLAWLLRTRAPHRTVIAAMAPVAAAALGWGIWVVAHRGGIDPALALNYGSYLSALAQAGPAALGVSAGDLPRPLAALTLGWVPGVAGFVALALPAAALLLLGLVRLVRRSSVGITLLAYGAILAVWPYPPDRFLWAVLPWLAVAFAAGAVAMWPRRVLRPLVALVVVAVAGGYGWYQVRGFAGRWWEGAARPIAANFVELLPGIRRLPPDAVVASDDEALVWLYTARRAVPFYLFSYRGRATVEPAPPEHRAFLERQGVTHVLLASPRGESARRLRALLEAYPGWLTPVQSWSGGRWLFAVTPSP